MRDHTHADHDARGALALDIPGQLVAVVVSHADAPIAEWSPLVLHDEATRALLERARACPGIRGIAVVATCSRTDLFAEADDAGMGARALRSLLRSFPGVTPAVMRHTRTLEGARAVAHLFRVAAGLESIALGEHEIQGQVRHALQLSAELHLTSPVVHRLLERALATGARVRHETRIGQGATTLGHAAAQAVVEARPPRADDLVIVIGAGHMAQQAARHARAAGLGRLVIVNRTQAAAQRLADTVGGSALPWGALPALLRDARTVVAAVRGAEPVIAPEMLARARSEASHPLSLVDLGSPPNIAPACASLPGVVRIDLDALHERSRRATDERAGEVDAARAIVDEEVAHFLAWYEHRRLSPTVRRLHAHFRAEAEVVVAREARRLGAAGHDRDQLQRFADALVRRLLHRPLAHLHAVARDASTVGEGDADHPTPALSIERLLIDACAGDGTASEHPPHAHTRDLAPRDEPVAARFPSLTSTASLL